MRALIFSKSLFSRTTRTTTTLSLCPFNNHHNHNRYSNSQPFPLYNNNTRYFSSSSNKTNTNRYDFGEFPLFQPRRVVVTGLGLVSPLGVGVQTSWKKLINGECGVQEIKHFDATTLPCKLAAMVPESQLLESKKKCVPKEFQGRIPQFIEYSYIAASEAINDSKYNLDNENFDFGVCIGSGIGSLEDISKTALNFYQKNEKGDTISYNYKKVHPTFVPRILINLASGHVSIKYNLRGPNLSTNSACATGAHAIGEAFEFIRNGHATAMLAGGSESCVDPLSIAGFCRIRALSTKYNDTPNLASRPFDVNRDGFVMGEGAAVLLLEEYNHALKRGAKIYAEIRGYGLSGDGYHITAPREDGDAAYRAMQHAITRSGIELTQIGYVNAHATSTPLGDSIEAKAIFNVFGDHAKSKNFKVSSTKGAIGHLLGAAGAVESIFTILAMNEKIIPPTLNLDHPEILGEVFDFVPKKALFDFPVIAAVSNSFGFGGTNASLVFSLPP